MMALHNGQKVGKPGDASVIWRLLRYLRPYRGQIALALILTLAVTVMELAGPYLFHVALDWYILPVLAGKISVTSARWGLGIVVLIFLSATLGSFLLQYMQVRIMQRAGQETMYDLRKEIFEHLQRLPVAFFDHNSTGLLVTRITTDVDALNDLFATGVVSMLNDLVLLVCLGVILLQWHPFLALVCLSPLPFILLLTQLFRNQVAKANRQVRMAITKINSSLHEHLSGMAIVQLFNRQQWARRQYSALNRALFTANKDAIDAFSVYYPAVEFVSVAGVALLYWIGGRRVIQGTVELGVLISLILYAQRFFRPIEDLSEKVDILQSAMAAADRIFELLNEPAAVLPSSTAVKAPALRGEIEFRNVWFAYQDKIASAEEHWVLRDVSFRIEAGQTFAVVGHTGAGKTTLVQLLLRFYEIQRGEILLDGTDIREMDVHDLRSRFGIVLQDAFLFSGTLESNVKLGTQHINRHVAEKALCDVGLGPYLKSQPEGIDTPVNERGSKLSMGQRQLVSFARALAHDPQFLILDEATSNVDTRTEHMIRNALDRLLLDRTALVIAHRLSTIQHAHCILVMHKGSLREQGTHQELLQQRGIYYRLYQLQYKDQELPATGASESARPLSAKY